MERSCIKCKYFEDLGSTRYIDEKGKYTTELEMWGRCRRFPPIPTNITIGEDVEICTKSFVYKDDWCYEYKEKGRCPINQLGHAGLEVALI